MNDISIMVRVSSHSSCLMIDKTCNTYAAWPNLEMISDAKDHQKLIFSSQMKQANLRGIFSLKTNDL